MLAAMKRRWKILLIGLIGSLAVCVLCFLFGKPATSRAPSLLVRSVRSPLYSNERNGRALLTLTNGSGKEVFFQTGLHHFLGYAWVAVERRSGMAWVVESEAAAWNPKDVTISTSLTRLASGQVFDFDVTLPADGQPRRIVVRWNAPPRKVPPMLRRIQYLWWQNFALKQSSFTELRSPEMTVTPGAPPFDFKSRHKMAAYQ